MSNEAFIQCIGEIAMAEYEKYRILPSLTIAQAILESNWGKSMLAQRAYNFFGMKAGSGWKGAVYNAQTREQTPAGQAFTVNAAFRAYQNLEEGIRGYYEFLQYPRYRNLKGITDYKEACRLIKADGWATDVNYAGKLISLIEGYDLTQYDEEVVEVVKKEPLFYNEKEYEVHMIRKEGVTYVKTRDIAAVLGLSVSSQGKIPVLKAKQ